VHTRRRATAQGQRPPREPRPPRTGGGDAVAVKRPRLGGPAVSVAASAESRAFSHSVGTGRRRVQRSGASGQAAAQPAPHLRGRRRCKECGGARVRCPHQRVRSTCKECGGASARWNAHERGGASLCPHQCREAKRQGVRGCGPVPAPAPTTQRHGVPHGGGRVDAGRPGGAHPTCGTTRHARHAHISLTPIPVSSVIQCQLFLAVCYTVGVVGASVHTSVYVSSVYVSQYSYPCLWRTCILFLSPSLSLPLSLSPSLIKI